VVVVENEKSSNDGGGGPPSWYKANSSQNGNKFGPASKHFYTRPWSLNLPPGTPIIKIVALGIVLERHMVTYASQTDVSLDTLSVHVHNNGVPQKMTKPEVRSRRMD